MEFLDFIATPLGKFVSIMSGISAVLVLVWKIWKWVQAIWSAVSSLWVTIDKTVPALAQSVGEIRAEVKPNGGSSLRDAVNRTERKIEEVQHTTQALQTRFVSHLDSSDSLLFDLDASGVTTYVNRALCDFCDCAPGDLLGLNWKNFVHPDDRERISREQNAAISDKRDATLIYRVATGVSQFAEVRATLTRLVDASGTVIGWSGQIRKV